jgi:hypothetical protein
VIRISLSYLYSFAKELEPLSALPEQDDIPYSDVFLPLWSAKQSMENMHYHSVFAPYLVSSRQTASALMNDLDGLLNDPKFDRTIGRFEIIAIKRDVDQYRIAFLAEVGILNSYFVTQKLPFDSGALLSAGENLMPLDLLAKAPEAIVDAREAGKCLAYEAPTAAGFHLFRVLESVLRRYYAHVTGGRAPPKQRNIAVYINAMRQAKKGDEKILSTIKQIGDHHRNPLSHPEAILTVDEAIAAAGIVRSAVTLMLVD